MVKAVIISERLHFVSVLLKELENQKIHLRISGIAENNKETKKLLEEKSPFLIFFDNAMKSKFKKTFFEKYEEQLICIENDKGGKTLLDEYMLRKIKRILMEVDNKRLRKKIQKEVVSIGYKIHHKGTDYLIETIYYICINDKEASYNLQGMVYPKLAEKFGKSADNIKSSITKATEAMYDECDPDVIAQYFKFCYGARPTVKQVICTVVGRI